MSMIDTKELKINFLSIFKEPIEIEGYVHCIINGSFIFAPRSKYKNILRILLFCSILQNKFNIICKEHYFLWYLVGEYLTYKKVC